MQVVDLFCGMGGFSAGAIDAGATVVLGADKDSVPLKLWAANVPGGRARLVTLGSDNGDSIELPPPSPSVHVHSSPPCTDLSSARNGSVANVEGGVQTLRWALDLVLQRGDHSWSIENVSTPMTRAVLTEYAERFPDRVGFATLDAVEFGAAQSAFDSSPLRRGSSCCKRAVGATVSSAKLKAACRGADHSFQESDA